MSRGAPGRPGWEVIVGEVALAAPPCRPAADEPRYQNRRARLLVAFDWLDDEGRDLVTDFTEKYALVLETNRA